MDEAVEMQGQEVLMDNQELAPEASPTCEQVILSMKFTPAI